MISKYKNKILGVRNYKSEKMSFGVEDFLNLDTLALFIDELFCCESDLTEAGKIFIEEYYGFTKLASLLLETGKLKEDIRNYSVEQLADFLTNHDPLLVQNIINNTRQKNGRSNK